MLVLDIPIMLFYSETVKKTKRKKTLIQNWNTTCSCAPGHARVNLKLQHTLLKCVVFVMLGKISKDF